MSTKGVRHTRGLPYARGGHRVKGKGTSKPTQAHGKNQHMMGKKK